jgi:hypothetical protein
MRFSNTLQSINPAPYKQNQPRNSATERIHSLVRPRPLLGFDGPAARYPLTSRAELLTAQAMDSLQGAAQFRDPKPDRGGLSTSFVNGFTACPTRHTACGLRLRIEAAAAAAAARGPYDNPRTLRLVGSGGVGAVVDAARCSPPPQRPDEAGAGERGGCRPEFRMASRLPTAEQSKLCVARDAAAAAGPWRPPPDLYPSPITHRRYCFQMDSDWPPLAPAGGPGRDVRLTASPARCGEGGRVIVASRERTQGVKRQEC